MLSSTCLSPSQVLVVCIFLFVRYKWYFAVTTASVIILYFVFTLTTTTWRDKFRRAMTEADNRFNQVATDALLNFGQLSPASKASAGSRRSTTLSLLESSLFPSLHLPLCRFLLFS